MKLELTPQLVNHTFKAIDQHIFTPHTIIQTILLALVFLLTLLIHKKIKFKLTELLNTFTSDKKSKIYQKSKLLIKSLILPLTYNLLLLLYIFLALNFFWPYKIITIISEILTAWLIIRLMSSLFKNTFIIRLVSAFILTIVILNIMNIYDRTIKLLDNIDFTTGEIRISLLLVIQGLFILSLFIWAASQTTSFVETKIKNNSSLTPSLKVLLNKVIRFTIFAFAIIISLSSIGIDLTAFTVLSGGIGVGIGFGLQKIVSNFISGIIILIDKSVKPGDVIEIDNTYGLISSLNSRFVSIVTLNGEEYLIPNEDLITKKVVNLSYSDKLIRLEIPVGISYNSDVEQAITLIEQVAKEHQRVTSHKEPSCLLTGFGASSVELKLKFWIVDPENGLDNIKSELLLNIWQAFQAHDIEIPYPQHDLHLQSLPTELK